MRCAARKGLRSVRHGAATGTERPTAAKFPITAAACGQRRPGVHLAGSELRASSLPPVLRGAGFDVLANTRVDPLHVIETEPAALGFVHPANVLSPGPRTNASRMRRGVSGTVQISCTGSKRMANQQGANSCRVPNLIRRDTSSQTIELAN